MANEQDGPSAQAVLQHVIDYFLDLAADKNGYKQDMLALTPVELASDFCDECQPFEDQYGDVLISCCANWLEKRKDDAAVPQTSAVPSS